jgi:hypothetical protein
MPQNAEGLNAFAWSLATNPHDAFRDDKRAVEVATRACELSSWKDADHIDTLAAGHAEAGDFRMAVRFQELAIGTGILDNDVGLRLHPYREGRAYRSS